ncbi:hypothetical protein [Haliangium ochraceum]|uniref:hypothetical protein n=1 Tax=Haliangium ochraceum TaxID=80816 RepID=UPI00019B97BF|nr:hypothetical protein [Haliangium ochraceum]
MIAPAIVSLETVAYAQDDDDWDDEEDDDDDWGEEEEEFEDEEENEDGYVQPPVTAGGLYTKKTYPVAALSRPLTVIEGMVEVRGGIDIDVSDETAFEVFRFKADARYGIADHVELQAVFDLLLSGEPVYTSYPTPEFEAGLGIEGGLYYDMVHFRAVGAVVSRKPFTIVEGDPDDPDSEDMLVVDPNAESETGFDLILGFPFRYRFKPEIAIIALDELMTIHFGGGKPDLNVGVGGVYQLIPQAAVIARAELYVPQFDTRLLTVPLTAAAQFSPNNQFDLGLEFTLPVDVRDEDNRFSQRSVLIYAQARL